MKSKTGIAAVICIPLIALAVMATMKGRQADEELTLPSARNHYDKRSETGTQTRQVPSRMAPLTSEEILGMSAAQWDGRLTSSYPDLDAEFRNEAIMLAGELKGAVAEGLDPQGEEAGAYAEAISLLLSEETAAGTR